MAVFDTAKNIVFLSITAFIVGLSFEAGREMIESRSLDNQAKLSIARNKHIEIIDYPDGFGFSDVRTKINRNNLEVVAIVSNSGVEDWIDPVIDVSVVIGALEVGRCVKSQNFMMKPGDRKKVNVLCESIRGEYVPNGLTVEPRVSKAWRERE